MKKIILFFGLVSLFALMAVSFVIAATIWDEINARVNLNQGYYCPNPYTAWVDTSLDPPVPYPTVVSESEQLYDCRDPSLGPSCCPIFSTCQESGAGSDNLPGYAGIDGYACTISPIVHCSQFGTENECEDSSTISIAIQSIETNPEYGENYCNRVLDSWEAQSPDMVCWNQTACECVWDSSDGCLAEQRIETDCNETGNYGLIESCDYEISYDDSFCVEEGGYIAAIWDLKEGDPALCTEAGTYQIPCENIMRLPFFTLVNVISVILVLVIIYYLYILKNKGIFLKKK